MQTAMRRLRIPSEGRKLFMYKKATTALLLLAAVFMQCAVFQIFEIASVKPNILLIVVVSLGLMRGRRSGLIIGFAGGVMMDIFFPYRLGMQALIYMWLGFWAGSFYRIYYDDDIKTPMLLTAVGDLMYGVYYYMMTFLLRGRVHLLYYLNRIILPELVYTMIITIVIYRLLYHLNRHMCKRDKRSIESFV